jgi:hypothetical protein
VRVLVLGLRDSPKEVRCTAENDRDEDEINKGNITCKPKQQKDNDHGCKAEGGPDIAIGIGCS